MKIRIGICGVVVYIFVWCTRQKRHRKPSNAQVFSFRGLFSSFSLTNTTLFFPFSHFIYFIHQSNNEKESVALAEQKQKLLN